MTTTTITRYEIGRENDHDGRCDYENGHNEPATWMIAENCPPEWGWGPGAPNASLAFYCDTHLSYAKAHTADLAEAERMAEDAEWIKTWGLVLDAWPEPVRITDQ